MSNRFVVQTVALVFFGLWGCAKSGPSGTQDVRSTASVKDENLRFVQLEDHQIVEAFDSGEAFQAALAKSEPEMLGRVLQIRLGGSESPMLGELSLGRRGDQQVLRLQPRFSLTPGLRYVAVFDTSPLVGAGSGVRRELPISVARPAAPPSQVVEVFPSGDSVPENLLRLYVHFSAPMRRGEAYEKIQIIGPNGEPIAHPFLELDEELWDISGRRLSLLIDPGRVKNGLKSKDEAGAVFEKGQKYALLVKESYRDALGEPLQKEFRKEFTISAAQKETIDPATWKLEPPQSAQGSLVVRFPKPLDHGLLNRVLTIESEEGKRVKGRVEILDHELTWRFAPANPWPGDRFLLCVEPILEDACGNNVSKPFEISEHQFQLKPERGPVVKLPFAVVR